jgi:hypothetical protein
MLLIFLELPMLRYLFEELTIFMSMLVSFLLYLSFIVNIANYKVFCNVLPTNYTS